MTKKHFIALALTVQSQHPRTTITKYGMPGPDTYDGMIWQWERMRDAVADFCASQNSQFDRARWLAYIAGTRGPSGGAR